MSYTKNTWESGEQITAAKLNNAEDGIENLDQRVETLEGHMAAFDTAQGNLLHFPRSIDSPIRDVILYGKSTQGGTPTPDAPVAVNTAGDGGTLGVVSSGKNFLIIGFTSAITNTQGVTLTPLGNGSLMINGSVTSNVLVTFNMANGSIASSTQNDRKKNLPNGTYKISGLPSGLSLQIRGTNSTEANTQGTNISITSNTFTIDDTYAYNQVRLHMNANSSYSNVVFTPVISLSTDTTTDGYSGTVYPVTVPSTGLPGIAVSDGGNYTDGSGQQWWCDTIDLGNGVYTQRVGVHTFTSAEISAANKSSSTSADIYLVQDENVLKTAINAGIKIDGSSRVKCLGNIGIVSSTLSTVNNMYIDVNGTYFRWAFVYGTYNTTTLDQFKTMMNGISGGVTVLYPLNPVETPLTDTQLFQLHAISTQKNETYMRTDGGNDLYCEAYINEKDLYDGLEDDIESMLTKIAPEYSASSTYNYGQLVTYNGNLYYCNTNITTAEAWTSGHWTACSTGSFLTDRALQSVSNYNSVAGIVGSSENSLALGDLPMNRAVYISTNVHPSDNTKTAFTDEPFFRFFGLVITIGQNITNTSGAIQIAMKGATNGGDDLFYRRGISGGWHEWYKIITSKSVAPEYDKTATYAKGDYCTYDNKLYTCKNGISTPKAWTSSDWVNTSVGAKLKDLESRIAALEAIVLES